jgi:thioesterase domain-containing protein
MISTLVESTGDAKKRGDALPAAEKPREPAPVLPPEPPPSAKAEPAPAPEPEEDVFVFPATAAQRRFWLLDQMTPGGNPALNIPLALRLHGTLDRAALTRSFAAVVQRHETLRTTFHDEKGRLCQVIVPARKMSVPLVDTLAFPEAERANVPGALMREEAATPFDLARGPLLRARLVKLGPSDYLLLVTLHHIISDGWSNGIILRELGACYTAFVQGAEPALAPLPLQFADYADWQAKAMASGALKPQFEYWRKQLAGDLPSLALPSARPGQAQRVGASAATRQRTLPPALARDLKNLGAQESASAYMVFLAGFCALMHRVAGGAPEDVVVSTPSANRARAEVENLVGPFVNPLLLRVDLTGGPTFRELLTRVRRTALDAFANADTPFEWIIEEIKPRRLPVNFLYQQAFVQPAKWPDLTLTPVPADSGGAVFEWTVGAMEDAEGVQLFLLYSEDLFDEATADRTLAQYAMLLEAAAAEPETAISRLPISSEEDRRRWLAEGASELFGGASRLPHKTLRWIEQCCQSEPGAGRPAPLRTGEARRLGQVLPGGRLLVLDCRLQPLPPGVAGQIHVGGEPVSALAFSDERFVPDPDPARPHERLFRTGDLGRLRSPEAGGGIEWLGRIGQEKSAAQEKGKDALGQGIPYLTLHYQLIEIWQEVLGVESIGIQDDFFDLGGNSLLALRMLTRVERACGKTVLPAALFKRATIEHLANELLCYEGSKAPDILKIQEAGDKTPIFYLHGDLTGGGYYCMKLSRRLGPEQPFYALPPVDVNAVEGLLSIEEMAAMHVAAIRAERPHGPYVLGGFCLGGLIAYEAAQQLEKAGERVERLLIIDAMVKTTRLHRLRRLAEHLGKWRGLDTDGQLFLFCQWHFLWARLRRWKGLSAREQGRILTRRIKGGVRRLTGQGKAEPEFRLPTAPPKHDEGAAPAGANGRAKAVAADWYDPRWDAPLIFLWATGGYRARPYAGRTTLLLSHDLVDGSEYNPAQDWKEYVAHLDLRELPGSHLACITEHVNELAETVRHCLEEPA